MFKDIKNIKVIGIDSITDYYDVNIKYERLKEIEALNRDWEFVHASISDKVAVEKIFTDNKIAVVVNLAAQAGVRYSITNPDAYIESNLIGFYNLLEACRIMKLNIWYMHHHHQSMVLIRRFHIQQMTRWIIQSACMLPPRRVTNLWHTLIRSFTISHQQVFVSSLYMDLQAVLIWPTSDSQQAS